MKNLQLTLALIILVVTNLIAQDLSIKVNVKGQGDPIILLPGFACSGSVWDETVKELADKYECHIVNYPGFGGVEPVDTLWIEEVKEDLLQYISRKNLNKVVVVGHSMGGTLALWLASINKKNIKAIFVIDALPCMGALMIPNYSSEKIEYDTPYSRNILAMDTVAFEGMSANMVRFMCKNIEKQKLIIDWMKQADRKTYVYGYTDLLKIDLREAVNKITVPVKILAATLPNKEVIVHNYNKQYSRLSNKEMVFVDDSAHFIMFDQFKVYMKELNDFLEK